MNSANDTRPKRIYIVSYDFEDPSPSELEALSEELQSFGEWCHYIDGTWLIKTAYNAKQIYSRLRVHLEGNVNILVVDMGTDYAGWLPRKAWEWIEEKRQTPDLSATNPSSV